MRSLILSLLNVILLNFLAFSQEANIDWSDRILYSNKGNSFATNLVGASKDYIYMLHEDIDIRFFGTKAGIYLVKYDKNNFNRLGSVALVKYSKRKRKRQNPTLHEAHIINDKIVLFFTARRWRKLSLSAYSYDLELNQIRKRTTLGTYKSPLLNPFLPLNIAPDIVLDTINEHFSLIHTKNSDSSIVYTIKTYSSEIDTISKHAIKIPVKRLYDGKLFIDNKYSFTQKGDLRINSRVEIITQKRRNFKLEKKRQYFQLSQVSIKTGDYNTQLLHSKDLNISDVKYVERNGKTELFGVYTKTDNAKRINPITGFLSTSVSPDNEEFSKINYYDLPEELKARVFDKKEQRKLRRNLKLRWKIRGIKAANETFSRYYSLEQIIPSTDNSLIFLTSNVNQLFVRSPIFRNHYTLICEEKSNLSGFRLNADKSYDWGTNIPRHVIVTHYDKTDVNVIEKGENLFVFYQNGTFRNPYVDLYGSRARYKRRGINKYEYGVINMRTGFPQVNIMNTFQRSFERKNRKFLLPDYSMKYGNEIIVTYNFRTLKLWAKLVLFTFPVFPPSAAVGFFGNNYKGHGYLGKISISK